MKKTNISALLLAALLLIQLLLILLSNLKLLANEK